MEYLAAVRRKLEEITALVYAAEECLEGIEVELLDRQELQMGAGGIYAGEAA